MTSQSALAKLSDSVILTVTSRVMMAIGLPVISLLYAAYISGPIQDLEGRVQKIEKSDQEQHEDLLKQQFLNDSTNKNITELSSAIREIMPQLRDLNNFLAVQKDRDMQRGKPLNGEQQQ